MKLKHHFVIAMTAGLLSEPALSETLVTVATPPYAVVDTGQSQCYNASAAITCPAAGTAFYGQDAQLTSHAKSYTLSANGLTLYDNLTGLTWQRSPETNGDGALTKADKLTYANALAHCAALATASDQGFNDWRLPTIKELYSLIDFSGTDPSGYTGTGTAGLKPFIDTTAFQFAYGQTNAGERIIDSQYASSTLYVDHASGPGGNKLFGVNFADGRIKGYDLVMPDGTEKTFFVQCVRGNPSYGVNAFVDNNDQTITDNATGLMWTKVDSGAAMDWQTALAWVQTKNAESYLGYNDWRMPNAKELQSILDYSRSPSTSNAAAIDPIFSATPVTNEGGNADWPWYWASTTHAAYNGMGASGVYVAFGRATGWQKTTPTATCYTLYDVHGAGAQRSDPKTSGGVVTMGRACNGGVAYGLGPQGDVQRAANYVRLVRGVTSSQTNTFSLSVSKTGNGTVTSSLSGIDCGDTCTANFDSGTSLALTATPASGYRFTGWGETCSGMGGCNLTLNSNQIVAAHFAAIFTGATLSTSILGKGIVTSDPRGSVCGGPLGRACSKHYATGTHVTLTAHPGPGFTFAGWKSDCSGSGVCQLTMDTNRSVIATFKD